MNYSVSVIIPVYNVARFIEKCVRQLFEQTLKEIEFIFVDDCSPDSSIAIVEKLLLEYPERAQAVHIIRHEINRGLPSARNSGLQVATGTYIFHCDSDDWLEKDALSLLYNTAVTDHADIVWCDWYLTFKKNERYMTQSPLDKDVLSPLTALKLLLGGKIRYNVWNKLVRRNLYQDNRISFPDGYGMGEDMTMIKLFAFAEKVSYVPKALYHYLQLNQEAFTKKTSPAHLTQIQHNVANLTAFLTQHFGKSLDMYIHFFKLNTKLPFLISADVNSYKRWLEWYSESNSYIDQNPQFSGRIRFIQKAAINHQFWVLKLYYFLVIRFLYGIIYK